MPEDWNTKIISEFRANGGNVGGVFEGTPLLLLHTKGAKTGAERVNPLAEGDERHRLWEAQKRDNPAFAGYETKTDRQIPVVVLDPKAS